MTSLLSRVSSLTGTIADRDALIGQVIDNLNAVLGPTDTHNRELSALIVNLQAFVSGLAEDREAIGGSLTSIADLTTTTAGLLEEGRPALQEDIASLGQLAAGLNTDESRELIEYNLDEDTGLGRKLELTMPLVSYGSWVNFYLCAVNFKLGPDVHTDSTPVMFNTSPRCEL